MPRLWCLHPHRRADTWRVKLPNVFGGRTHMDRQPRELVAFILLGAALSGAAVIGVSWAAGFGAVSDRLWSADTRHPTLVVGLDVPLEELRRRIEQRTRVMFEAGVKEEVMRALAGPISATARKAMGLEEVAELPQDEAIEALNLRTRRYAAYQRKWMRRIPGLVSVAADRPPGEVADEILEVVRARQRLPARRGRGADT